MRRDDMPKDTEIKETISLPDNVEITLNKSHVTIKGPKGELTRKLSYPNISITLEKNIIEIACRNKPKRKEKALIGTYHAHLQNMIKGVTEGFTYTMKTVYSHFPIKTAVEGQEFFIHNFLGERSPRRAEILENVAVEIKGDDVIVTGIDREKVGQTAANIERATKVKKRDIRVFQDGVYITNKGG
jgi:large subunit ribosomal protein L6